MEINRTNLFGAIVANIINTSTISLFTLRLLGKPDIGHWIGILVQLSITPLAYLLYSAKSLKRAKIYYIQISLIIVFIIVEFLLDWYPKIDFRDNLTIIIPYVMLFFGATGGMIGVASLAGMPTTHLSELYTSATLTYPDMQQENEGCNK